MKEFTAILIDVLAGALPLGALIGFAWWKITHPKSYTEKSEL